MCLPRRAFLTRGPQLRHGAAPNHEPHRARPQRSRLIGERCLGRRARVRDRRGLGVEAEMREDAPRDDPVADQGDELAPLAEVLAAQDVDREDACMSSAQRSRCGERAVGGPRPEPRPGERTFRRGHVSRARWIAARTLRSVQRQALASTRSSHATRKPVPGHHDESVDARADAARAPRDARET